MATMIVSPFFDNDNLFLIPTGRRARPVLRRCSPNPYRRCGYNPFSLSVFEGLENRNGIERSRETETGFETFYNFNGYNPEDIEVTVDPNSREITVKGSKTSKSDRGMFQKHFQRSFTLPENGKLDQIKTQMNKEGVLKISIPKDQLDKQVTTEENNNKVTQVQVGKETIEVEDIPEEQNNDKDNEMSNPDVILEKKSEEMTEEATKSVLKVPVEVEKEEATDEMETEVNADLETPFEFKMDIKGFNPNDVQVEMNKESGILSIHAAKKVEEEGTVFVNQMHRDLSLDGDKFDLNQLNCVFDAEGKTLIVTAPRLTTGFTGDKKNIPITFKN